MSENPGALSPTTLAAVSLGTKRCAAPHPCRRAPRLCWARLPFPLRRWEERVVRPRRLAPLHGPGAGVVGDLARALTEIPDRRNRVRSGGG